MELPAAGKDENLPERGTTKTPELVATVPAVTRNPEDLAALVETARGQLRMARAASMDLTCVVTTENLEATSPPDGKITVDILEAFSGYADFELWLKDTVTRGLGRKAKSGGYAFCPFHCRLSNAATATGHGVLGRTASPASHRTIWGAMPKLCRAAGGELEQIQLLLGYASVHRICCEAFEVEGGVK